MAQDDYDQGYEDGRRSRDQEIASWKERYEEARADLARERAEVMRYRAMTHAPIGIDVPF